MEFRCILFLDTSESDVLGASRCIRNVWFLEHTSEMPDLGPSRCTETLVSVGDTSGLRILCPSRCTEVQYQVKNTSGWANIGLFRCIASNRQISPKQNTSEFNNFIQSRCILINFTRLYLPSLAVYPRVTHFTQPTPTQIHVKADIILLRAGNRPYTEYRRVCRARLSRRYCRCRYFWQD